MRAQRSYTSLSRNLPEEIEELSAFLETKFPSWFSSFSRLTGLMASGLCLNIHT